MGKDNSGCFSEGFHREIGRRAKCLIVTEIDENGADTCPLAAIDVAPPIADHPRAGEVDSERAGRVQDHAWFGFPSAIFRMIDSFARRITDLDAGNLGYEFKEAYVHRIDDSSRLIAATDVGLVRRHDEQISGGGELRAGFRDAGKEGELGEGLRWIGLSVADDLDVQRSIAIQKNRSAFFLEGGGRRWEGGGSHSRR